MGRIISPGSRKIEGPWLLEKSSLISLGLLVDDINEKIKLLKEEESIIQCTASFKGGEKIVEKSISTIIDDSSIKDKCPTGLTIQILDERKIYPYLELEFDLSSRMMQSFSYSIKYIEDEETKSGCIDKIESWIEENQPSRFLQLWNKNIPMFLIFGYIALLIVLFAFATHTDSSNAYLDTLRPQLDSILSEGVNKNNYLDAIELLLIKEYSYAPASFKPTINIFTWLFPLLLIIVITLVGTFCPKASVAIGAGKKKVKFWKFYVKFITITIPTLIILPLILNFISSFIK